MSEHRRTDFEALLRRALAPVDPPEDLAVRLERHARRADRGAPPTSSRRGSSARCAIRATGSGPAAAIVVGASAGTALVSCVRAAPARQVALEADDVFDPAEQTLRDLASEARKLTDR